MESHHERDIMITEPLSYFSMWSRVFRWQRPYGNLLLLFSPGLFYTLSYLHLAAITTVPCQHVQYKMWAITHCITQSEISQCTEATVYA